MAKSQGQVTKIYQLRTLGYAEIHKELQQITKDFDAIKKAKREAEQAVASAKSTEELTRYRAELQKIKLEEAELRRQRQQILTEAKAEQIARQAAIREEKERKKVLDDVAGSYNSIYRQYRELYALLKSAPTGQAVNFRGQTFGYDEAITKLKQLAAAEQDFRRQFQRDQLLVGEYTSGIVQAFKQLGLDDLVGGQITKAQDRLNQLNRSFDRLREELSEIRVNGQGDLEGIERQLIENRQEALNLQRQVGTLQAELRGTGDIGNQITASLGEGFRSARQQLTQFVLGYVGFQALLNGIQQAILTNAVLSDEVVDLQRILGGTAEQTQDVIADLEKIDTRTLLKPLVDISIIAAKAGVATKDIAGVTKAIDELQLVAGKELGNVEQATESIVKLVNIFTDGGPVTGDAVRSIGNGLVELANAGVASGGFLIDFSQRMAGIAKTANLTLPSVLGLGAGFEELGQSSEVASSAVVQIMGKIATDVPKYAKLAGRSVEEFTKTLRESPQEALLQLAQNLKGDKTGFDEIATSFADAEARGVRVTQVLGVLATNTDFFRQKIQIAGAALNNTNAITDGANQKQTTFAATLDKVRKQFESIGTSRAFQLTLLAIASIVSLLIGNLPILIALGGLLAANWAVQNAQLLILRAQLIGYNLQIGASYVALGALTIAQTAYNVVLFISNGALGLVTRALAFFGITIRATTGPLGVILTLIGLLGAAYAAFGKSLTNASAGLNDFIRRQRIASETYARARDAIADQTSKLDVWIRVVRNASTSTDTKRLALQKLIDLNPAFRDALQGQTIDLQKLDAAYKQVTDSIRAKSLAEAAASLATEKQKNVLELTGLRQRLEIEGAQAGNGIAMVGGLTDREKEILVGGLFDGTDLTENTSLRDAAGDRVSFLTKDLPAIIQFLTDKENEAMGVYELYLQNQAQKEQDLLKLQEQARKQAQDNAAAASKAFEVDIAALKQQIEVLDDQINNYQGNRTGLQKLVADRKRLQDELDSLLNKNQSANGRGSRLSGQERDALRDIDAARDQLLAEEKLKRAKNELDEESYLRNILRINQDAIDKKLALIRGSDAAERKLIADLRLERITSEQETNNKIFELRKTALRVQLDDEIKNAQEAARLVTDNPTATATERAQAKLDADRRILELQVMYGQDIDRLEKQLGQQSLKNAKDAADAIRKTKQDLVQDQRELDEATLKDLQAAGSKSIAEFRAIISQQRLDIQTNEGLSPQRRDRALSRFDREENIGVLAREVASLQQQLPVYKRLLADKRITDEEYYKFLEELNRKQEELARALEQTTVDAHRRVAGIKDLLQNSFRDILNIKVGSEGDNLLGDVITQTYQLAQDAMNAYFDAEQQRIQQSRDAQLDRLDTEKQQVLARAQSRAEEESIEKQYAAKRREIEIKAGQDLKKAKLQEAKIAFAIELANIAASAAANPANAATFGAAGAIQFAVLGGLAAARYLLRVGEINRTQFEFGGQPGDVPLRGGKFGGKDHGRGGTPFIFKGQQYEGEVDELSIIRTKNAPRDKVFSVVGTQAQIASAMNVAGGGVNFAPGARLKRFDFGGSLGEGLQAPVFMPAVGNTIIASGGGITAEQFEAAMDKVEALAVAQNSRIDRLEVVQVTSTVTNAQKKHVKQSEVGTL